MSIEHMAGRSDRHADLRDAAVELAQANAQAEPSIMRILWFPHSEQIRLVEVDEITIPSDDAHVHPYYFSPVPDFPYVSAVAMIRPDEERRLQLPDGWGDWDEAQVLLDRRAA